VRLSYENAQINAHFFCCVIWLIAMYDNKDNKIFITLYLDLRRQRKTDGLYPLRVRIKSGKQTKMYGTGLNYGSTEYKKIRKGKRLDVTQNNELTKINAVLKRAKIAAREPFTFERFERAWFNKGAKADVFIYLEEYRRLKTNFNTSDVYKNTLNAIQRFNKKDNLSFEEVTPAYLDKLINWMQTEDGLSLSTVSMYLRCLRTVFNQANRNGDTTYYPFHNRLRNPNGFKIPAPKKGKIPLSDDDLEKLKSYQPTNSEQFWYDMFMFSYYAGGVNIKDIALMENKNLINGSISFIRAKTESKNPEQNAVPVNNPAAEAILNRWKTQGKYVFPLITEEMSSEHIHKTVKSKTRNINKVIKGIAKKLGIETPISSMTARHTFASKLARSGAPLLLIQQSLFHSNISTTQSYLAKFPDKEKETWFNKL
jgi:integrase/recombinase XerD